MRKTKINAIRIVGKKDDVIWEAADLLYFVSVLMYKEGVTWQDVYNELDRRHKEK